MRCTSRPESYLSRALQYLPRALLSQGPRQILGAR